MTPRASSSPYSPPVVGFAFLDARIRAHVEQAASGDPNPGDPLRGLYISDEQALALAADGGAENADARLADAAARLGLDALDTAVLGLAAAPELDPRYGRLFAYLHDDVTRRLASPRLVANLLAGDGVSHSDILACFRSDAPLRRRGAIRFVEGDGTVPLGDRPAKLADPLAPFLLRLAAPLDPPSGATPPRPPPPPGGGAPPPPADPDHAPRARGDGRGAAPPARHRLAAAAGRGGRRRRRDGRAGRRAAAAAVRRARALQARRHGRRRPVLRARGPPAVRLRARAARAGRARAAAQADRRAPRAADPARAHARGRPHPRRPHRAAGRGADAA